MIYGSVKKIAAVQVQLDKLAKDGKLSFWTSGTTGTPAEVVLTKAQLDARIARIPAIHPAYATAKRLFISMGGSTGFRDVYYAVTAGKDVQLPTDNYNESAVELSGCDVGRIGISEAVNFIDVFKQFGLKKVPYLVIGGDTPRNGLCPALLQCVCVTGVVSYGQTEFGTIATAPLTDPMKFKPAPDVAITFDNGEIVVNGQKTGDKGIMASGGLYLQ